MYDPSDKMVDLIRDNFITHRKKIARKLQIHSPAGLTIYALVNGLVNIDSLK